MGKYIYLKSYVIWLADTLWLWIIAKQLAFYGGKSNYLSFLLWQKQLSLLTMVAKATSSPSYGGKNNYLSFLCWEKQLALLPMVANATISPYYGGKNNYLSFLWWQKQLSLLTMVAKATISPSYCGKTNFLSFLWWQKQLALLSMVAKSTISLSYGGKSNYLNFQIMILNWEKSNSSVSYTSIFYTLSKIKHLFTNKWKKQEHVRGSNGNYNSWMGATEK